MPLKRTILKSNPVVQYLAKIIIFIILLPEFSMSQRKPEKYLINPVFSSTCQISYTVATWHHLMQSIILKQTWKKKRKTRCPRLKFVLQAIFKQIYTIDEY